MLAYLLEQAERTCGNGLKVKALSPKPETLHEQLGGWLMLYSLELGIRMQVPEFSEEKIKWNTQWKCNGN